MGKAVNTMKVEHCKKALEFFIKMNNSKSVLQYRNLGNGILDFHHTEVPPEQQGKGVAKVLVKEGFKFAIDNNLRVLPSCTYVAKYAKEFASDEEKAVVSKL